MSDLSKCNNTECPSHRQCWRYLCPADEYWQAYAAFSPDGGERCDYFINAAEWMKGVEK